MARLIVGHTGFVGGHLMRDRPFDLAVNSKTARFLRAARPEVDLAVCCGAPAVKWKANKDPEGDRAAIDDLWASLEAISAKRFVLISTVDVYPNPASGGDEGEGIDGVANHAYGAHRRLLEQRVAARWPEAVILRLPALYGDGLKKNVLYDLLAGNMVEAIRPDAAFQWYGLHRLWSDIDRALAAGVRLVNLVPATVGTGEIVERLFPTARIGAAGPGTPPRYDLRTRHAALFGGAEGVIETAAASLSSLSAWVERTRAIAAF